ncbi:MAG TPA: arsenite methyltransferase [Bdellovibrionota bacterium]|nr:arsenite methyltransferase [Bdellovibrionota bacterium]
MNPSEKVREGVSKSYAKAVEGGAGCCAAGNGSQKGVLVREAGYQPNELKSLPKGAVENSFGCGNPVGFSRIAEGEIVVDLGSGAGIDLFLAAERVGEKGRVIGIDMTDAMVRKARENIGKSGWRNIEVRKGLIEELPVESNSVDWVISNCVINLSPEKDRVFQEIHRVLKPGGKMLVADLVAKDLPDWVLRDAELYCSCIAGAIPEDTYIGKLRDAGMGNVRVEGRLEYEDRQIESLVASEVKSDRPADFGKKLATDLSGRIASVRVYAEKPAV